MEISDKNISGSVDPDSVKPLIDWFHSRFGLSMEPGFEPHALWSHVWFGFSVTYQGEIYAAVPEMVLQHTAYGDNSLISKRLGRRPTLEEVQKNLASFHGKLNSVFLEHRHDPWHFFRLFKDNNKGESPTSFIANKIYELYSQLYKNKNYFGENGWMLDYVNTLTYYERCLIPPEKRLPLELFDYAEQHFGSMPPRDEEAVNGPIVDPEEMKQLFPQYADGMEYFCGIIEEYYGWEPFGVRYNRLVSQESRAFIAQHEGEILAVFRDMEAKVAKTVSSLGDVKTLEPLSPERIEELYHLCVQVDDYIKQETGQYPHEMTLEQIRALPIELLVRIREEFPWPHFGADQPSSEGAADDPRLVFACLIENRGAFMG